MAGGARMQIRMMGLERDKPDAYSGKDGAFALKGLEEGQYSLAVVKEGFARKTVPSVEVKAAGENVWPAVTLTAGASAGLRMPARMSNSCWRMCRPTARW